MGRIKVEEKVWVRTEPGRTSAKKVTDKGALSKHSCRTCVHICVFVYTHRLSVSTVPMGLRGFAAEALINPQPPLALSREPASLSTHYFSNPRAVIKDKDAFCILSPLLCYCFHPSIHPSTHWSLCSLLPHWQDFKRVDGIPVVFACYSELRAVLSLFCQILCSHFWHECFWHHDEISSIFWLPKMQWCNEIYLLKVSKYFKYFQVKHFGKYNSVFHSLHSNPGNCWEQQTWLCPKPSSTSKANHLAN